MQLNYEEMTVEERQKLRKEFTEMRIKRTNKIKNLLLLKKEINNEEELLSILKQIESEKSKLAIVEREIKKSRKKVFIPLIGKRSYIN